VLAVAVLFQGNYVPGDNYAPYWVVASSTPQCVPRNGVPLLNLELNNVDLDQAVAIAERFGFARYGYVVTPNVDHVLRYFMYQNCRPIYQQATFSFLDSRFLAHLLRVFRRQYWRVCTGSDLTRAILSKASPENLIVLVGATRSQADDLRSQFGLLHLIHIAPPMGFIGNPDDVEACLRAIEATQPFRYCFLAVGSPQQEILALKLKERGTARGLALCVGASINYLTGAERRAPIWMQRVGLEWLYRLAQNPRRLTGRYLIRGPLIFVVLWMLKFRDRPLPTSLAHVPFLSEH